MRTRSLFRIGNPFPNMARLALLATLTALLTLPAVASTDVWASHVTAAGGWKTTLSLYSSIPPGDPGQTIQFQLNKYDETGSSAGSISSTVSHGQWKTLAYTNFNYEGSARITSKDNLVVKVTYQYGDTPSVCEFYLTGETRTRWVLPNTQRPWMDYTGLAVLNPSGDTVHFTVEAWKNGARVGQWQQPYALASRSKYVRLSDQMWAGVGYADADTFIVTTDVPIQAPLSITGNYLQDRHLFFAALSGYKSRTVLFPLSDWTMVWADHVTAAAGWHTSISLFNPDDSQTASYTLSRYDENGVSVGSDSSGTIPPHRWLTLSGALLDYEGSALLSSAQYILVKIEYQYADSHSVCEFYLSGDFYYRWVLPNTIRSWMDYTGVAMVNNSSHGTPVNLVASRNGQSQGSTDIELSPFGKYARLTDGIWSGIGYQNLDTIRIEDSEGCTAPISITGNNAQDRHLFFAAQPKPPNVSGEAVIPEEVVGSLRYIREGTFIQGSPADEPCRLADETQFTHTLTRGLICMEMEMTRLGWTTLKARQPTLPADPSTDFGMGMLVPVQRVTWYEAILFANLLSVDSGLEPCYYKDAFYTIPVDATNYTSESFYCNFDATGYRLPTEGEWEYICRAGGTGPFQNTVVPNYTEANCGTYSTAGMYPELEALGWFSANSEGSTHPCGMGQENDWGMLDMIGNVLEWCWDYYGTYPTGAQSNYTGGAASVYRVIRGGAWDRAARYSRSARRGYCAVDARFNTLGFRLVRTYR